MVAAGVPEGKIIELGVLVAGVPAKVIRTLAPEEIERSKKGALVYVKNGSRYRENNII